MIKAKIIFLDVDGVLNNVAHFEAIRERQREHNSFAPECVENLNTIIKNTGAFIVMSSTWRLGRSLTELRKLLADQGVRGTLIGKTPNLVHQPRGKEISIWLEANSAGYNVESFVILDDETDMCELMPYLVRTHIVTGLSKIHVSRATIILNEGTFN